jgi:hypothetical protein
LPKRGLKNIVAKKDAADGAELGGYATNEETK